MATAPKPPKTPDTFDLRRPVGPLPLLAWIVVGAIAAFLYWRRRTEGGWFGTSTRDDRGDSGPPGLENRTVRGARGRGGAQRWRSDEEAPSRDAVLTITAGGPDGTAYGSREPLHETSTTTSYSGGSEGYTPVSGTIKPAPISTGGDGTIPVPRGSSGEGVRRRSDAPADSGGPRLSEATHDLQTSARRRVFVPIRGRNPGGNRWPRGSPRSERTTNEALNVPDAFQPLADTNVFETA